MRATVMYAAGDVRVEEVPDARIAEPTDAVMRVTRACICGSDLWPYGSMEPSGTGQSMGHEAIGVVEAGLCAVIAARRLGAEQVIILGRHTDRTDLARDFGATDVVAERGEAAVERVKELTGGEGAHAVLECVGHGASTETRS